MEILLRVKIGFGIFDMDRVSGEANCGKAYKKKPHYVTQTEANLESSNTF